MSIRIDVAIGELVDKITILEIKQARLHDPTQLHNVEHELGLLLAELPEQAGLGPLREALKAINERIWATEDDIRDHERRLDFGPGFIRLARAVYRDNDERARLKRRINEALGSAIIEEKSHTSPEQRPDRASGEPEEENPMPSSLASIAGLVLASAAALLPVSAQAESADARFKALYTTEWDWRRTELPYVDDTPTKPIVDHLPKLDEASQQKRLAYWTEALKTLDTIPRTQLSPAAQVDYDVYRPQLEVLIAGQHLRDYEMPANSDTAFWTEFSETARKPFRTLADYQSFIKQMQDIPRYFREEMVNMRAGLKRGLTPPRITLEGRDGSITAISDAQPEATYFYLPYKTMPDEIPAAEQATLRDEALKTIRDTVIPAYAELLKFWREDYVPATRTTLAAADLPDGKAFYKAKILEFTTLDRDPESIHQFGLTEVAKLHDQMVAVMKESGFTGDFPAFLAFLRSDPQFYAKTPDELLMRAAWIAKKFDGKASQYFGYLPRARFAIRPVPDEMAPFYTGGRGGPGVYLLNTYDLPSRPLYNLTALTLHESAPGHAFQMPLALEHKDQPAFRQNVYISAYGEGWAVYCEKLGLEMGMYETPYDRFGMLSYQIWRAARLVVDTGLHAKGWSREQAIAYLHDNTALPEREIRTEVDRYIAWPAQALSYYLGADTIWRGRAKAEKALGDKFNIRAFHDMVLELGSVPLPVLEARIDRFIAEGGKGPYSDME